jgi:hypothetical protein
LISWLSGDLRPVSGSTVNLLPAPAARLMVSSLMVMTASSSVSLPSNSLTCPGIGRISAFVAAGLRSDRSAIVLSS